MIYPTLKQNKEDGIDIIEYVEDNITCVGTLFGNKSYWKNPYVDGDYTEWDKLEQDIPKIDIEKKCWETIKEEFKYATKGGMFRYGNIVFDFLDCPEIVYNEVEELIKMGELKKSDIIKIKEGISKKGYGIKVEERYGENNIYCRFLGLEDLADKYFPCTADETGCTNCCNCD